MDSGGGIYAGGEIIIKNNVISDNSASKGGGIYASGNIINNLIHNNTAGEGGGIYGSGNIINNTIVNNSSYGEGGGGGIKCIDDAIIINTIIYGNSATEIEEEGHGGGWYILIVTLQIHIFRIVTFREVLNLLVVMEQEQIMIVLAINITLI